MESTVSIIIPTLNEEQALPATLACLKVLKGWPLEVIVSDAGSTDRTLEIAHQFGAKVLTGARGRGPQQHLGAMEASGEVLWFLHADTHLPPNALEALRATLASSEVIGGHFHLRFTGTSFGARFVTGYQFLLRKLKFTYGDTAIFLRRSAYRQSGGFAAIPLFDDLELTRKVRRLGRFISVPVVVTTSSRRFEGRLGRTLFQWLLLQALYDVGVSSKRLARLYRHLR